MPVSGRPAPAPPAGCWPGERRAWFRQSRQSAPSSRIGVVSTSTCSSPRACVMQMQHALLGAHQALARQAGLTRLIAGHVEVMRDLVAEAPGQRFSTGKLAQVGRWRRRCGRSAFITMRGSGRPSKRNQFAESATSSLCHQWHFDASIMAARITHDQPGHSFLLVSICFIDDLSNQSAQAMHLDISKPGNRRPPAIVFPPRFGQVPVASGMTGARPLVRPQVDLIPVISDADNRRIPLSRCRQVQ